jgi:FixJ family two-component response regulator
MLNEKEKRIIHELILGTKQKDICRKVLMSNRGVEEIIRKMKTRFECQTTPQLIAKLIKNDLLIKNAGNHTDKAA